MGTVVGVTPQRADEIEAASVQSGRIEAGHLFLVRGDASEQDVGLVGGGGGSSSVYMDFDTVIDQVDAAVVIDGQGRDVNGYVFKANALAETEYGQGQAFLVLEEGVGDADDATATGSVMFRVDRHGNIGTAGGLHVATGLRNDDGQAQAVWIDPSDDMIPLVIHNPSVAEDVDWTSDFVRVVDVRNANDPVFRIDSSGSIRSTKEIFARDGLATRVVIGDTFGFAGISFGSAADTLLYRTAVAGIIGVANALEFTEMTSPGVATANKVRLFSRDNGAGKTQLCAIFSSGALQVLATQP